MILLRRVIGDALRARRQSQHRTLREVSTAANVSLGYLSEIERGQKEASSELLAAICDALGAQLSELLREVSQTVEVAENLTVPAARPTMPRVPTLAGARRPAADAPANGDAVRTSAAPDSGDRTDRVEPATVARAASNGRPTPAIPRDGAKLPVPGPISLPTGRRVTVDGDVSVSVRQDSPLKATLRTKRNARPGERGREVVCAVS